MKKLDLQTPDLTEANIAKIAQLFPQVVTEAEDEEGKLVKKVDFDKLRQELSKDIVEDTIERYRLDRPGKKRSILKANTPITKTLRPVKEDSVNWDTTENLYLEGDNFEILKVLQESYLGKIKMIYIDPPYNTGKDFVYRDDFKVSKDDYEAEIGAKDEEGGKLFKNTDTNGRYHSDWLSMMYSRLTIARDLLRDDGIIFMSIDDNEVHNLRKICDEIFGEENLINMICVNMSNMSGPKVQHAITGKRFPKIKEYILLYSKSKDSYKLTIPKFSKKERDNEYNLIIPELTSDFGELINNKTTDEINKILSGFTLKSLNEFLKENDIEDIDNEWKYKNAYRIFASKPNTALLNIAKEIKELNPKIHCVENNSGDIKFIKTDFNRDTRTARIELLSAFDKSEVFYGDHWDDIVTTGGIGGEGGVPYPNAKKPIKLMKRLIETSIGNNEIVMDFFAGSSSTAHAIFEYNLVNGRNNKFIMVQIEENLDEALKNADTGNKEDITRAINFLDTIGKPHLITELGKERIRRAGKKILEENKDTLAQRETPLDIGFRVYKTDTSNMKDVYYHPSQISQEKLGLFVSNVKDDRTPEDLLTQVMLDLGLTLDLSIEEKKIKGNKIFFVAGNSLVACFDEKIDFAVVDEIAESQPLKVVFRDASFTDDKDRINVETRMKRLSPETIVSVI